MADGAPLRIGLLGCGAFARRYHVPALLDMAGVRTTLIADPQRSPALEKAAEELGATLVDGIEPLLAGQCDAVIVSTPHTLHYRHVAAVLDSGRHVLVDKPFVMRTTEAEDLAKRAHARGLVAGVAFNRRLDRGCLKARELIRSGALGAIRYIETVQLGYERSGWFLDPKLGGGGPYTGRASHMVDLIPWLTGATAQRLRSRLRVGPPGRSDHGGFIDIVFDAFECRMTCIEEGWHMWDEIRIFGDEGMIELRRPLNVPIGWRLLWSSEGGDRREEIAADATPGGCTRDFIAAVRERRPPVCSFADGVASVRLVEAAFESANSGERWIDLAQPRREATAAA
jgi:predicted dehydrogenase